MNVYTLVFSYALGTYKLRKSHDTDSLLRYQSTVICQKPKILAGLDRRIAGLGLSGFLRPSPGREGFYRASWIRKAPPRHFQSFWNMCIAVLRHTIRCHPRLAETRKNARLSCFLKHTHTHTHKRMHSIPFSINDHLNPGS